jgi:hypothetical protein
VTLERIEEDGKQLKRLKGVDGLRIPVFLLGRKKKQQEVKQQERCRDRE